MEVRFACYRRVVPNTSGHVPDRELSAAEDPMFRDVNTTGFMQVDRRQ
jgi:hypothetical protein